MSQIAGIRATEAFDSRGTPTIAVTVALSDDSVGTALIPSGASVGSQEAVELRDGDPCRFQGRGVLQAISNVLDIIQPALLGRESQDQLAIDSQLCELDGTENKSRLGANALLGVSLANVRAAASSRKIPLYLHINELANRPRMSLPVPFLNVLNGGAHANNNVDIQEFMIAPSGTEKFQVAMRAAAEVFYELKQILESEGLSTAVGDEGGFAPDLESDQMAIEYLISAIKRANWEVGKEVFIGLDCAASEFFDSDRYELKSQGKSLSREEWLGDLSTLTEQFPVIKSIEDGIHETDYLGWQQLQDLLGKNLQLVGDDVFVTNPKMLQKGIDQQLANAILIKVNQIGTLSETLRVIQMAQTNGFGTMISHRSGDTEDTTIADLAVGTGAGQIKAGSMSRSERVAKYNRLLQIEHELENPIYAGNFLFQ